ncbi:MAG TPA: ABC transporter ATP-binding protein, partial [Gemmatimonadales bacterium]|nr:ABC transporter ATP-binding protein [Gemmatimonadales bacterium]
DLKLRKEMQLELKALNRRLGITFVYVTHDQEEALTMSDRIAVMDHARVAQLGTPAQVYEDPRTAFVAGFIGASNFLDGRVTERADGDWLVRRPDGRAFRLPGHEDLAPGRLIRIAIRPEWLDLFRPDQVPAEENALDGVVGDVIYLGETIHVLVEIGEGEAVTVALRNEGQLIKPLSWRRGDAVAVGWLPEDAQLLEES